jgi:hypothetical protein
LDAKRDLFSNSNCQSIATRYARRVVGSGFEAFLHQGVFAGRPHAPIRICSTVNNVTYDANGNTLSYDVDGAAAANLPRSFVYDGENRPLASLRPGPSLGLGAFET